MKKSIFSMFTVVTAMSFLVSCGKSETPSETNIKETSLTESTAVTTTAVTTDVIAPYETTVTASDENAKNSITESTVETIDTDVSVVTASPQDFDVQLDSMISSIEVEIPDITVFTGFNFDNDSKPKTTEDKKETTTTKAVSTATAVTTTASTEKLAEPTSPQEFIFDNKMYNNAEFVNKGVDKPANWTATPDSATPQYENSAYPMSFIIENPTKGAAFTIAPAKKDSKSPYPSVQFYKGITWGASESDILSAYGEPIHKGSYEQYNTSFITLYYRDSSGATIIYEVSKDWGLVAVDCNGV